MKRLSNDEAAIAYADLAVQHTNSDNLKLQYEASYLDFLAGAKWKEKQLALSAEVCPKCKSNNITSFGKTVYCRDCGQRL